MNKLGSVKLEFYSKQVYGWTSWGATTVQTVSSYAELQMAKKWRRRLQLWKIAVQVQKF